MTRLLGGECDGGGESGLRGNMRGCDLGLLRGLGVRGGVVSSRGKEPRATGTSLTLPLAEFGLGSD